MRPARRRIIRPRTPLVRKLDMLNNLDLRRGHRPGREIAVFERRDTAGRATGHCLPRRIGTARTVSFAGVVDRGTRNDRHRERRRRHHEERQQQADSRQKGRHAHADPLRRRIEANRTNERVPSSQKLTSRQPFCRAVHIRGAHPFGCKRCPSRADRRGSG